MSADKNKSIGPGVMVKGTIDKVNYSVQYINFEIDNFTGIKFAIPTVYRLPLMNGQFIEARTDYTAPEGVHLTNVVVKKDKLGSDELFRAG